MHCAPNSSPTTAKRFPLRSFATKRAAIGRSRGTRARTTSRGARRRCARASLWSRAAEAAPASSRPLGCPCSPEKCHRVYVDRPLVAHGDAIEDPLGIAAKDDLRAIAPGPFRSERGRGAEHLGVVGGGLTKPCRQLERPFLDRLDFLRLGR